MGELVVDQLFTAVFGNVTISMAQVDVWKFFILLVANAVVFLGLTGWIINVQTSKAHKEHRNDAYIFITLVATGIFVSLLFWYFAWQFAPSVQQDIVVMPKITQLALFLVSVVFCLGYLVVSLFFSAGLMVSMFRGYTPLREQKGSIAIAALASIAWILFSGLGWAIRPGQ